MVIDKTLLEKLQRLASLELSEKEQETAKENLSEIVNFIENINKLDLEGIPTSFNPLDTKLPMRDDTPHNNPKIAQSILKNAPLSEDNFFIVPKIIE